MKACCQAGEPTEATIPPSCETHAPCYRCLGPRAPRGRSLGQDGGGGARAGAHSHLHDKPPKAASCRPDGGFTPIGLLTSRPVPGSWPLLLTCVWFACPRAHRPPALHLCPWPSPLRLSATLGLGLLLAQASLSCLRQRLTLKPTLLSPFLFSCSPHRPLLGPGQALVSDSVFGMLLQSF